MTNGCEPQAGSWNHEKRSNADRATSQHRQDPKHKTVSWLKDEVVFTTLFRELVLSEQSIISPTSCSRPGAGAGRHRWRARYAAPLPVQTSCGTPLFQKQTATTDDQGHANIPTPPAQA